VPLLSPRYQLLFLEQGAPAALYGFKVHCTNAERGCEWIGELGQLHDHLNTDPVSRDEQLKGSNFTQVQCIHCFESLQQNQLAVHQDSICESRPFVCEHCNEYESTYLNVVHKHWPVCGYQLIDCTYSCGLKIPRRFLEKHLDQECPLAKIDYEFKHAGCEVRLSRKDMHTNTS
jgi:TNF receptor-associated factor 4